MVSLTKQHVYLVSFVLGNLMNYIKPNFIKNEDWDTLVN